MIKIQKAGVEDAALVAALGRDSFYQSHGHSASKEIVDGYAAEKFSVGAMRRELEEPANIYHILYFNNQPAGYSKIIFNAQHPNVPLQNATKLERLYLLQEFIQHKLGAELLLFNIGLSKAQQQSGMWLFVWKENHRAFAFYQKFGFRVIGSHDFQLSPTHANPNHQLLLEYPQPV